MLHSASVIKDGPAKKIVSIEHDINCIGGSTVTNSKDGDEPALVCSADDVGESTTALEKGTLI